MSVYHLTQVFQAEESWYLNHIRPLEVINF
uniref:Uncharacterized protein n=1 Tax=virus sp. ctML55 TaxID=2827627 RepID=A0A8S5RI12_9VIRU|nr:MAG TPA: hypothetical protein [virus sp. ctML55]DAJ95558.1 MAG TPA: hypothetical protein [Caudoviricetes sp.]DAV60069.1 MAG TPA: hypothetical protein [Caudoviricetes sp.]